MVKSTVLKKKKPQTASKWVPPVIREIQIKSTLRFHFIPIQNGNHYILKTLARLWTKVTPLLYHCWECKLVKLL